MNFIAENWGKILLACGAVYHGVLIHQEVIVKLYSFIASNGGIKGIIKPLWDGKAKT